MKEFETRIIKIDVDNIRNRLKSMNAKKVKMENQINSIYDYPDKRLIKNKGYARIRVVDNLLKNSKEYYMTTKKLVSQGIYKVMEENEIKISDENIGKKIFESLGLVLYQDIKKYRESYKYKHSLIEIDINDKSFCPFPYLEIETDNNDELNEIVNLLGYNIKDTTSDTIYEIINRER
ncbi:CYTH domain-containing protein [Clostridium sp. cel8]|uniref:class IV adenylate cyclase n=1 Tax=unclassified Clostridium TaxID=2614128 RepID=UPI0015F636DE|nr:CYTH domain-containing protein [Clostridium sp. cel8]MBA5851375.1 CYTH domain-containing protein [Clostridium sp. cel8]